MADTLDNLLLMVSAAIAQRLSIVLDFAASFFMPAPAQQALPRVSEPRRLTVADQWNSLTDIIMNAASRAEEAARCQASATQQLDLAQYALTSLVDELSAVMEMGGRRRRATVHVLGVASSPSRRTIGDAIAA